MLYESNKVDLRLEGYKNNNLALGVSEWVCPECHTKHDRDINAGNNLANMALRSVRPEVKPVEMEALAVSNNSETTVKEAGTRDFVIC